MAFAVHLRPHTCVFITCLSSAVAAGCGDPPAEPPVHISLSNMLAATSSVQFARESFAVNVSFPSAATDGGFVIHRAIFWNHDDPFAFDVQLPAGDYGPPIAEVHILLQCPSGSQDLVIARGASSFGLHVNATSDNAAPAISMAPVAAGCP